MSELIHRLLTLKKQEPLPSRHTFFEAIGRVYDEDLISRMLADILADSPALCSALIERYGEKKGLGLHPQDLRVGRVRCEEFMDCGAERGRADLFLEAKDGAEFYTVTIENKILSHEHGRQTVTYARYVLSRHPNARNIFFYLKPDFVRDLPACELFAALGYGELSQLLEEYGEGTVFEADLREHIKKYFIKRTGDVMETDIEALTHYSELKEILKNAEKKYDTFRSAIACELLNGGLFGDVPIGYEGQTEENGVFVADFTGKVYHRLYRNKLWRNEQEGEDGRKYYFYLETVLPDDPAGITTQFVVRCYGKEQEKSDVFRFLRRKGTDLMQKSWGERFAGGKALDVRYERPHFVFSAQPFLSDKEILSEEWVGELRTYIRSTLAEYAPLLTVLFETFLRERG